ncbi:MAG TPA: oligosaccharide flippase family protein [Streptosporangiaceae bacterium]|nr:oligosaccharide flippase family protein [Streptosporangiaceae bacterium]
MRSGQRAQGFQNVSYGSVSRRSHTPKLSRSAIDVLLTVGSQGAERVLSFVAVTIILRDLPTAQGGTFVLMLKVAGFTGVLATLGLQAGAVRLISGALAEGRENRANALLRVFLQTRINLAVLLVLTGALAGPWIASHLFRSPSVSPFVEWGCVSAATNGVLMFSLHHLQARQLFVRYTILVILTSLTKLIAITLLIIAGFLSDYAAAAIWTLLPVLGAVFGLFLAPRAFILKSRRSETRLARADLAKFGRWLTLSSLIGVTFTNLDSLLVTRYLGFTATAWYGAALNLSLAVVVLATALFTVLLPAVSRLSELHQLRRFFRRALLYTTLWTLSALPVLAASPWLVRTVYGNRFLPAVSAFEYLFVSALLTVIYATAGVVFLARGKPIHVVGQAIVQLASSVPFYITLIPHEGIIGGAIGTCAGQAAALIYVIVFGTLALRDVPADSQQLVASSYAVLYQERHSRLCHSSEPDGTHGRCIRGHGVGPASTLR